MRIKITDRNEVGIVGNDHLGGVATVFEKTGLGGAWADHFLAGLTRPATGLTAAPTGIDENRPHGGMQSHHLVPESDR
jgi:hypothetical protein